MNHLVLKWLKKSGLAVPLVTTVTDMVTPLDLSRRQPLPGPY
jgi:hypothetical protein